MESQLHRPTAQEHRRYEEDPDHHTGLHSVMEGEGDNHHGEKKSVLRKVKDKAKKLKNTITKHGHGHEHDEYDDDDDETVVDSDVHGAPMRNEADFISGTALPKQTGLLNLGNQTSPPLVDRQTPSVRNEVDDRHRHQDHHDRGDDVMKMDDPYIPRKEETYSGVGDVGMFKASPALDDPYIPRKNEYSGVGDVGIKASHASEDPYIPRKERKEEHSGVGDVGMFKTSHASEDPYIPRKEEAYSGVGDVGMFKTSPTLDDPFISTTRKEEHSSIGDEGMFKTTPTFDDPFISTTRKDEHYSSVGDGGMFKASPALDEPYIPIIKEEVEYSSGVGDFGVSDTLGRRDVGYAPKTDLLDPLPASMGPAPFESARLANVDEPEIKIGSLGDLEKDPHAPGMTTSPNYQTKVVDPTGQGGEEAEVAPILERLGNLSVDDDKPISMPANTGSHDQFAPANEQLNVDSEPESMPQATVTGKISSVTSAIADKATSAKNMVASSLGYGGSHVQEGQEPTKTTAMGTVSEYGHMVAEKLAPVYGKAAGAGSAIMSKVQGRGGGEEGAVKESDKGVSVQGYLAEKFSPGEEDKELSKVITDAIHRKKEGSRVAVEEAAQEAPVKERVTVEAVCSDEKAAAGVVDRVKGAIGSWLGSKGQHPDYDVTVAGEGVEKEEVRKMQESGN